MLIHRVKIYLVSAIFITAFAACDNDQYPNHHEQDSAHNGHGHMMDDDHMHVQRDPG